MNKLIQDIQHRVARLLNYVDTQMLMCAFAQCANTQQIVRLTHKDMSGLSATKSCSNWLVKGLKFYNGSHKKLLKLAVRSGNIDTVKVIKKKLHVKLGATDIAAIARKGDLKMLKYCIKRGNTPGRNSKICTLAAARSGHLKCLKYLRKNGYIWDHIIAYSAILHDRMDCFKYAHLNGCSCRSAYEAAAVKGNVECLNYLIANNVPMPIWLDTRVARRCSFKIFKLLCEAGMRVSIDAARNAVYRGHMSMLEYLYDRGIWDETVIAQASDLKTVLHICSMIVKKGGTPAWNFIQGRFCYHPDVMAFRDPRNNTK